MRTLAKAGLVLVAMASLGARAAWAEAAGTDDAAERILPASQDLGLDAKATVIDFDDGEAPCLFGYATALRGKIKRVKFRGKGKKNGGAILDQCSGFEVWGHSPPNFLAFRDDAGLSDGGSPALPEIIKFKKPSRGMVTLLVGTHPRHTGTKIKITAKLKGGGSQEETVTLINGMHRVTLPGPKIKKIKIESIDAPWLVVDDITF